jgi:hypothetical protein
MEEYNVSLCKTKYSLCNEDKGAYVWFGIISCSAQIVVSMFAITMQKWPYCFETLQGYKKEGFAAIV